MSLIPPLEKEEAGEIAGEVYKNFEEKTGSVPQWVKVMAHNPEIAKEFTELFEVVMKQGEIKPELKWKIAYTISDMLKCPFCVNVTEKMLKKFGAKEKELEKIKKIKDLPEEEAKVLELVKDVTVDGHLDNPVIFDQLKEKFSNKEIIEIISVIGFFNYINRFNNSLGILPE